MADKDVGLALLALGGLLGGYNRGRQNSQALDNQRTALDYRQQQEQRRAEQGERRLDIMEQNASRPVGQGSRPTEYYLGRGYVQEHGSLEGAMAALKKAMGENEASTDVMTKGSKAEQLAQLQNALRVFQGFGEQAGPAGPVEPAGGGQAPAAGGGQPGFFGGGIQQAIQQAIQGAQQGGRPQVQPMSMPAQGGDAGHQFMQSLQQGLQQSPQQSAIQSAQQPTSTGAVPMPDPRMPDPRAIAAEGAEWGRNAPLGDNAGEIDRQMMSTLGANYNLWRNAPDPGSFMAGLFGLSKQLGLQPPIGLQEILDSMHDDSLVV